MLENEGIGDRAARAMAVKPGRGYGAGMDKLGLHNVDACGNARVDADGQGDPSGGKIGPGSGSAGPGDAGPGNVALGGAGRVIPRGGVCLPPGQGRAFAAWAALIHAGRNPSSKAIKADLPPRANLQSLERGLRERGLLDIETGGNARRGRVNLVDGWSEWSIWSRPVTDPAKVQQRILETFRKFAAPECCPPAAVKWGRFRNAACAGGRGRRDLEAAILGLIDAGNLRAPLEGDGYGDCGVWGVRMPQDAAYEFSGNVQVARMRGGRGVGDLARMRKAAAAKVEACPIEAGEAQAIGRTRLDMNPARLVECGGPRRACQWIDGDPLLDAAICGAPSMPGQSWCAEHHARVFQGPAPRARDVERIAGQAEFISNLPQETGFGFPLSGDRIARKSRFAFGRGRAL